MHRTRYKETTTPEQRFHVATEYEIYKMAGWSDEDIYASTGFKSDALKEKESRAQQIRDDQYKRQLKDEYKNLLGQIGSHEYNAQFNPEYENKKVAALKEDLKAQEREMRRVGINDFDYADDKRFISSSEPERRFISVGPEGDKHAIPIEWLK